ncbi:Proline--tRNA ligase cytoplasmic [Zea mays]|uniref:proline--tRNA ligase n=1 Tax=Zea mays TaxID=4577 RepID=A0A1D6E222_MAIZE|nr:Proline--tRNA ligase cytoplasmic [Zea mays]
MSTSKGSAAKGGGGSNTSFAIVLYRHPWVLFASELAWSRMAGKKKEVKKETKLGMAYRKDDNFGEWYSEVVVNSEMIEYYDISGCYILRPWAMEIWELMKEFFDAEIKKLKLKPYYFPLFVTENVLQKEKDHIEGFAPEVLQILELYRRIYEEFLAVPVSKGRKSEVEKFAGGLYTTSVEAFIPNTGRGIQGATSHCLGQNFAKMFDITFENEKGVREMVWQNSWAYTTRSIGVMVMTHGDDKGLVLPPKVAPIQVIVISVPYKDADTTAIKGACESTVYTLNQSGIRADQDTRENYSPGWKYSHWEMKGVPLRIEIGPKDLANKQVRIVRRDNGAKVDIPVTNLVEDVKVLLDEIQKNLFKTAQERRDACVQVVSSWDEFTTALNNKRLILAPWCDEEEVEKDVKARTKGELGAAKTLCTPFEQPELPEGILCFASGKPAKKWSFWGRSY